ncbi:MAG: SDR family NAD(P)-dependent oxidoreductase [Candidatus Hodarchaeota archaeon]
MDYSGFYKRCGVDYTTELFCPLYQSKAWEMLIIEVLVLYGVLPLKLKCDGNDDFLVIEMRLKDKVAIITGCTRGFGKTISMMFAKEGASVSICDISPVLELEENVGKKIREFGGKVLCSQVDVSNEEQVFKLIRKTVKEFGKVNILVNNVGIAGPTADCQDIDTADWDKVMAVNLRGTFLCCKAVFPEMIKQKSGRIINISSIRGKMPFPQRTPYATSKMGIIGFTRSLAAEVGQYNITVNAICPSVPQNDERAIEVIKARATFEGVPDQWEIMFEESLESVKKTIPLGRLIEHEDVASLAVFLASNEGKNITGEDINVSAGKLMG